MCCAAARTRIDLKGQMQPSELPIGVMLPITSRPGMLEEKVNPKFAIGRPDNNFAVMNSSNA